jgi:hypothetical protein
MMRRTLVLGGIASGSLLPAASAQPSSSQPSAQENAPISTKPLASPRPVAPGQSASLAVSALSQPAIDSAKRPFERDEPTWSKSVEKFRAIYGELPVRYGPNPSRITTVDKWVSSPFVSRHTVDLGAPGIEPFPSNQVEALLAQTSDLLDRASRARDALKEKSAKGAALALEIDNFLENDAIHQDEVAAGIYTVPYQVSLANLNAQISKVNGLNGYAFYNSLILNTYFSAAAIDAACTASEILSWLSFIPNYQYPFVGNALVQTFNGVAKTAPDHAVDATTQLSTRSAVMQSWAYSAQGALQSGALGAASASQGGASVKTAWALADVDFKRRRTQAARDIADYKLRLATEQGGAFNYPEQIGQVKRRLIRDLVDAIHRARAAAFGLRVIYGRDVALPPVVASVISGGATDVEFVALLEELTEWVRNGIEFLTSFALRDQTYTVVVSLRQHLAEREWQRGLEQGTWVLDFDEVRLRRERHVRIRGVSVFVRGPAGFFRGEVSIPKFSFYHHLSGAREGVDQGSLPSVRIGKVGMRGSEKYRQAYGTTFLRNTAPFGPWTITLNDETTQNESRKKVTDVELDVDLTVRAV